MNLGTLRPDVVVVVVGHSIRAAPTRQLPRLLLLLLLRLEPDSVPAAVLSRSAETSVVVTRQVSQEGRGEARLDPEVESGLHQW